MRLQTRGAETRTCSITYPVSESLPDVCDMYQVAYVGYGTSCLVLFWGFASKRHQMVSFKHQRNFSRVKTSLSPRQSPKSCIEAVVLSQALGISVTRTVSQPPSPRCCAGTTENDSHLPAEWKLPLFYALQVAVQCSAHVFEGLYSEHACILIASGNGVSVIVRSR